MSASSRRRPRRASSRSRRSTGSAAGYPGDYTREWATLGGGAGSWLRLAWSSPVASSRVVLYDRPNADDQITAATLRSPTARTLAVGALANNGTAVTVTFSARTVTSLRARHRRA